jgi:hypothetical protein
MRVILTNVSSLKLAAIKDVVARIVRTIPPCPISEFPDDAFFSSPGEGELAAYVVSVLPDRRLPTQLNLAFNAQPGAARVGFNENFPQALGPFLAVASLQNSRYPCG